MYQWYKSTEPIPGATTSEFKPLEYAYYKVAVMYYQGCESFSDSVGAGPISVWDDPLQKAQIIVFPNPATGAIHIEFPDDFVPQDTIILDILGEEILKVDRFSDQIDVSSLSSGIYFLRVQSMNFVQTVPFVIMK